MTARSLGFEHGEQAGHRNNQAPPDLDDRYFATCGGGIRGIAADPKQLAGLGDADGGTVANVADVHHDSVPCAHVWVEPGVCPHETTEPVYAYLHHANPKVGDPVLVANHGKPVAQLCTACLCQLHPGWGCPNCTWDVAEVRRFCDPVPELIQTLVRPCQEHA